MRVRPQRVQLVFLLSILALSAAPARSDTSSALIQATRQQDVERVRRILSSKADVNARQGDGSSALHWASYKSNLQITDLLLRSGANPNAANDLGATPLWIASSSGNTAIVARLLQAGAEPNLALASGETPVMSAARSGSVQTVRDLLVRGANVNAKERSRSQTALMWAVEQNHADVARVLLEGGADVHARSAVWYQLENTGGNTSKVGHFEMAHGGSTPILIAARQSGPEVAQVLLDAGANVNDATAVGTSALVIAAHSDNGKFAEYLLSRGAEVDAAGAGYTALHAAVLRGNVELVKSLLDCGANPNVPVKHGTPGRRFSADYSLRQQWIGINALWLAAQFGEVEIMRLLLEKGADPLVKTDDGTTTMMAALSAGGVEVDRRGRYVGVEADATENERAALEAATLLIAKGVDVNAVNNAGDTALHLAARQLLASVVEFLVQQGAVINALNKRNETPLTALTPATRPNQPVGDDPRQSDRERIAALLRQLRAKE